MGNQACDLVSIAEYRSLILKMRSIHRDDVMLRSVEIESNNGVIGAVSSHIRLGVQARHPQGKGCLDHWRGKWDLLSHCRGLFETRVPGRHCESKQGQTRRGSEGAQQGGNLSIVINDTCVHRCCHGCPQGLTIALIHACL